MQSPSQPASSTPERKNVALVLSGALAKGGFEAGVLSELLPLLSERKMNVSHIVAASAGALSGTVLAAGLRAGRGAAAAERLHQFWEHEANLKMFRPSLSSIALLRGPFTMAPAQKLLREYLRAESALPGARASISLSIIVARLVGNTIGIGDGSYSSFEQVMRFHDADLEDKQAQIVDAACASGSVPFIFSPLILRDRKGQLLGPCIDGGAVNNTPIKEALGPGIDTLCVISPFPRLEAPRRSYGTLELVDQLLMILLNERLFRDLREAQWANSTLERIDQLVARRSTSPEDAQALKDELLDCISMPHARKIRILEIRPPAALEGNSMSALFSQRLRRDYLAAGKAAVRAQINSWT